MITSPCWQIVGLRKALLITVEAKGVISWYTISITADEFLRSKWRALVLWPVSI